MSEEAKVAYLQEKINEARRNERLFSIVFIALLIIALITYNFFEDIVSVIIDVTFAIGALVLSFYWSHQKEKLMEQLKSMDFRAKCPKCGKEIPKGNFIFCPFCGAQLQRK